MPLSKVPSVKTSKVSLLPKIPTKIFFNKVFWGREVGIKLHIKLCHTPFVTRVVNPSVEVISTQQSSQPLKTFSFEILG